uniref:ATP synthase F0 subunit 8 n=1 Tax=Lema decempunctata TaxID=1412118 RepID=UPI0022A7E765|nr:ATP synthase F0 subunit 8 [Lema decempunctata]UZS91160.1 ATP synthase F0 subunit 8 [Lema decempunctata]
MPQMAPLNWIMLMIYFMLIFMMINIINYYINLNYPNMKTYMSNATKLNWKW